MTQYGELTEPDEYPNYAELIALPAKLSWNGPPPGARTSHNQLRRLMLYPDELVAEWWPLLDLNQRPGDYESLALTTELKGRAQDNNGT